MMMLQDMGLPVEAERGRYGGYHLRPGFKLPPLMFSEEEAVALTLGLRLIEQLGFDPTSPAIDGAAAKLERVLPAPLRQAVQAIQKTLVMDLPRPRADFPTAEVVLNLSRAVNEHRRVYLRYRSWSGDESERLIDPYGLACRTDYWYMAGYCHLRQDLRTFRLDRVIKVELTDETFDPPNDFDMLAQVENAIATTPGTWFIEALLDTTLVEAQKMVPAAMATLEETNDGVWFRCYVQHLDWVATFLADLGCPVQVHQPPELLDYCHRLAANINHILKNQGAQNGEFKTES
jgi:predicted DNA-binding transcriptional regulator YafY